MRGSTVESAPPRRESRRCRRSLGHAPAGRVTRQASHWWRYYRGIASVVEAMCLKRFIVMSQPPADCAATRGKPRINRGPRTGPSVTGATRRTGPSGARCDPAREPHRVHEARGAVRENSREQQRSTRRGGLIAPRTTHPRARRSTQRARSPLRRDPSRLPSHGKPTSLRERHTRLRALRRDGGWR